MVINILFLACSLVLTLLFFVYAFNLYYLLRASSRYVVPQATMTTGQGPPVVIHLPVYNEKYVVRRIVAACADMARRYGTDRTRILIIDDSDDSTTHQIDDLVTRQLNQGIRIEVVRRGNRRGFKAGALQLALERTEEEFIAIFDADFIPAADFLNRTLPYLVQDKRLGAVQSRWAHINRDYNLVTRAIALGIDVHFFIEQPGRDAAGCYLSFNGSGGVFRKSSLLDAGGWQADTLAEDLDVSYRIQSLGYRILYLKNVVSPGEVPPTVPSFKEQQARWACGSLRTAKKILPHLVVNHQLSLKKRLEACIHLTNYMVHPLMLASFLLACMAVLLGVDTMRTADPRVLFRLFTQGGVMEAAAVTLRNVAWVSLGSMILLSTLSAWIHPLIALRAQGLRVSRNLSSLLVLYLLGCGISLSNTIEAGKALLTRRDWAFKRTPKYAIQPHRGEWRSKSYQVPLDSVWYLELGMVILGLVAIGSAAWQSDLGALPILAPYTMAYAFVVWHTIRQSKEARSQ